MARDAEMDDEVIAAIVRRNVYVMPNLGSTERGTYAGPPPGGRPGSTGPRRCGTSLRGVIQRMNDSFAKWSAPDAARARERYAILQRSGPAERDRNVRFSGPRRQRAERHPQHPTHRRIYLRGRQIDRDALRSH
jgi:hypothetical protein